MMLVNYAWRTSTLVQLALIMMSTGTRLAQSESAPDLPPISNSRPISIRRSLAQLPEIFQMEAQMFQCAQMYSTGSAVE